MAASNPNTPQAANPTPGKPGQTPGKPAPAKPGAKPGTSKPGMPPKK